MSKLFHLPKREPAVEPERPTFLRPGETHFEHVMEEAIRAFARASLHTEAGHCEAAHQARKNGEADLAHAALVAITKREDVAEDRARSLFRRVTDAAGCFR